MQRERYHRKDSSDGDEGFEKPQPETFEFVSPHRELEQPEMGYNSIALTVVPKKTKYFSVEKPLIKYAGLEQIRKSKNTSYNYIKSSSLQKTFEGEGLGEDMEEMDEEERKGKQGRQKLFREKSISIMEEIMETVVFKTKRTEIGEDLVIKVETRAQEEAIKEEINAIPNAALVYKENSAISTHSFFKKLMKINDSYFLDSKYNGLLKQKLGKMKGKHEQQLKPMNSIDFKGDFESGNLDHTLKVGEDEFNIYLRIDTNTRGHQSWFYFKVANNELETKRIKINICNLKRKFRMMDLGQKIYIKTGKSGSEWAKLEEDIEVVPTTRKRYRLQFEITLFSQTEYLISLIPPYTYSNLLKDVEVYEKSPDVKVQILTHSLTGLAVPMLTVTKGANLQKKGKESQSKKRLFLISGRIHPSETCSSYIINGLIRELISGNPDSEEMLKSTTFKIVPMLNPDGVVFGNFRTNYLGDDLNRSFHRTDDSIYPEIVALKELGKLCKENYGDNFMGFLDMHGHSSQPNSFVYGPEYENGSDNYIECRILPKILDQSSKYFKYDMSNFKLQEYKFNTARGYFFRKLKVPAYTIETSYALYNEKGKEQQLMEMSVKEWSHLGEELAKSLSIYSRYLEASNEKKQNQTMAKKFKEQKKTLEARVSIHRNTSINRNNSNIFNNEPFKQQFSSHTFNALKKEILNEIDRVCKSERALSEQSDGQSLDEDLSEHDKELLIKKVREAVYPSFLFPRVLKPAIILPSVMPSIVIMGKKQIKDASTMPRLVNKFRNKRFNRPMNINSEYTEYLMRNIANINSMRPEVITFNKIKKPKLELTEEDRSEN